MKRVVCSRCIYDTNVPNIHFDSTGVCNYCSQISDLEVQYPTGEEGERRLKQIVEKIRKDGHGKKYDAVVGVSGGCDSSYLVHKMVTEYKLRVLAVHFDNTWNSTVATENIYKLLDSLNVDLYTLVVDNKEIDDIYMSFMKAGVKDIDIPTDIGLATTLYRAARKYNLKYMIEGHSFRTEGVAPLGWIYMDGRYIRSVHQRFGVRKMVTFPNLDITRQLAWMFVSRIKKIRPLYYIDYDKEAAKRLLAERYDWKWYGGHHLENRFSAFFHGYFLPTRWNIDFRIAGHSAYCRNNWMSREEALALMAVPPLVEPGLIKYVKTRFGLSDTEFKELMELPKRTYSDYPTYKRTFERLKPVFWLAAKFDLIPQSFYIKYANR
jgi:N-acetyl sugar amidotransferase